MVFLPKRSITPTQKQNKHKAEAATAIRQYRLKFFWFSLFTKRTVPARHQKQNSRFPVKKRKFVGSRLFKTEKTAAHRLC